MGTDLKGGGRGGGFKPVLISLLGGSGGGVGENGKQTVLEKDFSNVPILRTVALFVERSDRRCKESLVLLF